LLLIVSVQICRATSITSTWGSVIYLDTAGNVSPNLLANYVSYNVTNDTGAAITDAWVTLGNFTGGFVSLAPLENGIVHLGPMAAGATRTVYFYLTVDCSSFQSGKCNISTAQNFTVNLYSGPPATNLLGAQTFSVTVQDTTAALANKVNTVVASSTSPILGSIITLTITGNTGTIGSANVFYHSPATFITWPASSFRLYSMSITFSGGNIGTYTNQLLVPTSAFPSSSATDYTIVATLLVVGSISTPTTVSPVSFISSGTQIKHTDTGNNTYTTFSPIPPTSNTTTLTKLTSASVLPTGGTTTYTLRATNTGSSATTLDNFVDTLPSSPASVSYIAGSSKFNGSTIPDPVASGSSLTWTNTFSVASNGTSDLTFQATVPNTAGTYTNSGIAHTGTTQIDTTLLTTDNSPATVSLNVGTSDLTITKAHSGNFTQGQTGAIYTITANNVGTIATSGTVTVTDTLPSGLTATAISGSGWACTLVTLTCTRSDALAVSTSYPAITLTVNVASNAAASITNSASVSGGGETNTGNDTATDATTIIQPPDLTITKTHSGSFTQGQTGANYTITVTNNGTAATAGTVTVTDTLPTGLTATAMSGTGWSCTLGTLTCTRSDALAVSSSYPAITLTVNVASNAAVSVTNNVTVSGGGEINTSNDSASDATSITQLPDLTIAKTHSGSFTQGQTGAAYTITVTNGGSGPTSGTVTVTDTLPAGLTASAINGTGWACTLPTLTCSRSDALGASSSYPAITLTVNVAGNAAPSVTNAASVSGGGETNTSNDSASDATTITQLPDLIIAKTHSGNFTQGQTGATYTITVSNSGTGPTSGIVTVVDTLPSGLTATAISGTGWTCTVATLTCTRSDALAASSNYPAITLTVNVANNAAASATNNVAVSGGGETNTANDSASDVTTITQLPDLTITKAHSGNFTQGQTGAAYTITVTNSGSGPTSGTVTVTDTLPTGLTATAISGTGWSCTLGTLTCTRSDVLAGSSSYPAITLTVNVASNAAASVTNTVAVSGGGETNTANDSANDVTTISAATTPDLTITKTHSGNFTQGQTGASYTIAVTNSGTAATVGIVTVTDTLPAGLTATAINGTGWSCTLGSLTCTRSDVLSASSSYPVITLTVNVAGNAAASVTNTVAVSGGGETNASNDSASDATTIVQLPDLTISKTHSGSFTQGQTGAVYTISVTNNGSGPSSGSVTVTDTLPIGLTATTISGTGWSCTLGTLTCTRSDVLPASSSYPVITLTVNVAGNAGASVTNTVAVSGGGEANTGNDSASDATTVNAALTPDLTISKTHSGNFTQGQTGAAYTITVTNSGGGSSSGTVTVTDTLPSGLTATAISGAGWSCTLATLTCTRSDVLVAGNSHPAITLTVNVASNAASSVTNTAAVSGGGETNTGNDSASDATTITQLPDLTITKTHTGNFTQGQTGAVYTIVVTNSGAGPTNGTVTVADTLPGGLTASAISGAGWICTLATLTCTRSDVLSASASYPAITLTVNVANNAAASVANTVAVSGGSETNTSNDSASDATTIAPALLPDLTISKTHNGNFTQGQSGAVYTITVTNSGNGPTNGTATVTDTLPTGMTATAISGAGWSCTLATLVCTRSDALGAGNSYPAIALTVNVASNAAASVTNTVAVSGGGEVNTGNDVASDVTTVIAALLPDLTITKTHSGNFTQGQTGAVYTITARNSGAGSTSGTVTVTDTLPTGLTATAISGTGWSCTLVTLTCTRSDVLAAGNSYPVITLTVNVASNAASSVSNTAAVAGGGETNTSNDSASDATTVIQQVPDLTLTQNQPANLAPGGTGSFTLLASNIGNAPTTGLVTVTDTFPVGLTPQSVSAPGWTCNISGQSVTCTRTDVLSAGASYPSITVTISAAKSLAGSVVNNAVVSGGGETNIANDSASASLVVSIVVRPDQLLVKKSVDRTFLDTGDVPFYSIQVTNTASVAVENAQILDHLPNGFQFIPGSARMTSNAGESQPINPAVTGNDLVFTIGHLAANANVLLTYRVRIAANASVGANANTAVLTALSSGVTVTSAQARAVVNVGAGLMSPRQVIVGRVFEDVNGNGLFDQGDRPIAGVRIYLSNGQSVITDSAGLYNIPSLRQGSVVLSLDPVTLPVGYGLRSAGRRDGESWTRLLRTPIGGGALLRQNFALQKLPGAPHSDSTQSVPSSQQNDVSQDSDTRASIQSAMGITSPVETDITTHSSETVPSTGSAADKRRIELSVDRNTIPADSRSSTLIHIRVLDEHGKPLRLERVRIRTSDGQFVLDAAQSAALEAKNNSQSSSFISHFTSPGSNAMLAQLDATTSLATSNESRITTTTGPASAPSRETLVPASNDIATVRLFSSSTPGTVKLEAETDDSQNPAIGHAELYFSPEQRSAILVVVGEVAIGRAAPDFSFTNQSGNFSRRADFFFRKSVFADNLLTLGYTSESSVNSATGVNGMFQLDPLDRVYPVFGDSSLRFAAAQANSRVYGRLDHGKSYLLFGDLHGDRAHLDSTNISDFDRNLTGLKAHWERSNKDQFTLEGARPQTAFARDVFAGNTFGLIHLSHMEVLPGSETVTLEVRDRRNPEVLVTRESLARSVDYTLDWNTGSVLFLRSMSSLDQSLNLIQLIITYEYQNTGLTSAVYSAQGSKRFESIGMSVGASFLTQRDGGIGAFYLSSLAFDQTLPRHGRFHFELPVTHGTVMTAGSFFGSSDGSSNADGMAVRATLDQPFVFRSGTAHFSFSRTDEGFSNPFGATTLPGSQIARGSVELTPVGSAKLQLGFTDERNSTSLVDNQRQTASVQWKQPVGEKIDLTAGYDFRNFKDALNPRQITSDLASAGVDWRITSRLQASVRREQNLTDSDPTYPSQTLLSARYQINAATRLFLTQRFASAPIIPIGDLSHSGFTSLNSTQETSLGVETRWRQNTSLTSRYQIENGMNGTDSFAAFGVVTRIPISQHFATDLGMERGEHLAGTGNSYDSGRFGLAWMPNDRYRASARYELRDQGGLGQIFSLGSAGKITDSITVLGQFQHSYASFTGNTTPYNLNNTTQGTAALAFRPLKSDRAGLLFSYTLRQMQIAGAPNSQNDNVGLLSTDGYLQATRNLELYGKVALSDRTARIDNGTDVSTMTYLFQGRTQLRVTKSFDAAAEARLLRQPVTATQRWSMGNEVGYWVIPDLRLALGYNYKSIDEYRANFLANPVRRGVYFVMSTKLSNLFNLFGTPKEGLVKEK